MFGDALACAPGSVSRNHLYPSGPMLVSVNAFVSVTAPSISRSLEPITTPFLKTTILRSRPLMTIDTGPLEDSFGCHQYAALAASDCVGSAIRSAGAGAISCTDAS